MMRNGEVVMDALGERLIALENWKANAEETIRQMGEAMNGFLAGEPEGRKAGEPLVASVRAMIDRLKAEKATLRKELDRLEAERLAGFLERANGVPAGREHEIRGD